MNLYKFLKLLKNKREYLTVQQYKVIRGQAISGDIVGANKGLVRLLSRGD